MLQLPKSTSRGCLGAGALGLALLLASCAPRTAQPAGPRPAPAVAVSAVEVRRGDIHHALTYAGDIRATGQIAVIAKGTGRVERLAVDVGSRVRAGDPLAELEQNTALTQLWQARAALAAAEAKLAQVRAGGKVEDVAAARAALAQQQVRLSDLRSGGRADDVALAQAALDAQLARLQLMEEGGRVEAVAQAQAGLDAAQARLASVRKGATDDTRQAAISAVESSRAAVAAAEAALANFLRTGVADVQSAQSAVETSRAAVIAAETALANFPTTYPSEVQAAQSAYTSAQAQANALRLAWDQAHSPTAQQLADAEARAAQAQSTYDTARARVVSLTEGMDQSACMWDQKTRLPLNPTACNSAISAANADVSAAQEALKSARSQLEDAKRGGAATTQSQMRAQLEQAESAAQAARAKVDAVTAGGYDTRRTQLQSQLDAAREQLGADQVRLAALTGGGLAAQQAELDNRLVAAREKLKSDQARLDEIQRGPQVEEVQQAEAAVREAEQRLAQAVMPSTEQELRAQRAAVEQARVQLEKARLPYTDFDIQQQEQSVAQARAALQGRQNPYTPEDFKIAEAGLDQARAQLELAEIGVRETRIYAPVDGVVAERLVAPGAMVSPSTPLLTLVPPGLELVVNVEEAQLGQVMEGQPVRLQVAAYPGETFTGSVVTIAPTIDVKSRTASVRIIPRDEERKLRAGMLARLEVVTAARSDVLLVPKDALLDLGPGRETAAMVVEEENRARRVPVQTGLANERFVEIASGLRAGQVVVTSGLSTLTDGDIVLATITPSSLAYAP